MCISVCKTCKYLLCFFFACFSPLQLHCSLLDVAGLPYAIFSGFPTYCRWARDVFLPTAAATAAAVVAITAAILFSCPYTSSQHNRSQSVFVCLAAHQRSPTSRVVCTLGQIAFALIAVHAFYKCALTNQLAYFSFLAPAFSRPPSLMRPAFDRASNVRGAHGQRLLFCFHFIGGDGGSSNSNAYTQYLSLSLSGYICTKHAYNSVGPLGRRKRRSE